MTNGGAHRIPTLVASGLPDHYGVQVINSTTIHHVMAYDGLLSATRQDVSSTRLALLILQPNHRTLVHSLWAPSRRT